MRSKTKRIYGGRGYISQLNSSPNIEQTQLYDQLTKVQQIIHSKLSQVKKLRNMNYLCEHTNVIHQKRSQENELFTGQTLPDYEILQEPEDCKQYLRQINYYDQFWKLFLINQNTAWKVKRLHQNVQEIKQKTKEIQVLFNERQQLLRNSQNLGFEKLMKKRNSSKSWDVNPNKICKQMKRQRCPYYQCYKQYSSVVSLNLHIKLKHNGGNKSERQVYAEKFWQHIEAKKSLPQIPITFAPGYIEEYGMMTGRMTQAEYQKRRKQFGWADGQVDIKNWANHAVTDDKAKSFGVEQQVSQIKQENW